jgi:O-antigen ligase
MLKLASSVLLIVGLLLAGVLATDTELLFFWPACLALGAAAVIAVINWRIRVYSAPSDVCLLSVLLFAGYISVRALLSPVETLAIPDLMMMAAAVVTYILVSTTLSHPAWRLALLGTLVLLLIGNLAVGSVQFSGHWSYHVVPHFVRTYGEGRVGGFFNNANHLAAFISAALCLTGGIIFFGRAGVTQKLLLGFIAMAASVGLVLTKSRAGLGGVGVGLTVLILLSLWVLLKTSRHRLGMLIGGGSVVSLLIVAVLYQVGSEAISKRSLVSPLDQDVRQSIWRSALWQHELSPIIGTGARMFSEYGITLRDPGAPTYQADPIFVHNEYLQLLADYGLIGLILLVIAILFHWFNGLRFVHWYVTWRFGETAEIRSNSLGITIGALAASVGLLAQAAFEFHLHSGIMVVLAGMLGGVLMNPGFSLESHTPLRFPGLRVVSKVMMMAAGAVLLWGAVTKGPADYHATRASLAAQQGDPEQELAHLDHAIQSDPKNAEWHYRHGLAELKRGVAPGSALGKQTLASAEASFKRATELNPYHYLYAVALTDALDASGKSSEALQAAQMAVKAAPWHEESRLALAMHYARQGDFQNAERAFLWARAATSTNRDHEMNWFDYYQQTLRIAAAMARKQAATP